ncbi:MAG: DUF1028 domain-containing protein [Pseudomonadota bacterium]
MTFSIVAQCFDTGMFGVAVASSSPAVAARCAFARAGVGAVASQNVTDPALGPQTLDLMERGASAQEAVAIVARASRHAEFRQILAVDRRGDAAIHSGHRSLGIWTAEAGAACACGGNLLANESVPGAMTAAFEQSRGHIGDRLIATMRAALVAGGEAGPIHSAGMLMVREMPWPVADLRCDWTMDCPVELVATAWDVYKPQLDAYVTRARNPAEAPSYGVPGDA